jgi:hypothetical protein
VELRYGFDGLRDAVVRPDNVPVPYIEGRLAGTVRLVPAKRNPGNALVFNGVDNMIFFPASFTGPQDGIKISICPASNPGDAPLGWTSTNKEPRVLRRQYVFAADSPDSGFRMQAWLEPGNGAFTVMYAGVDRRSGQLGYRALASKTVVWRKDLWTDIEFHIDQRNQFMRLVINGQEEARVAFDILAESRTPHRFVLGGSRRDGLPFCGLMDDFCVSAGLPAENWIFPEGTMEYAPLASDPFAAAGAGSGFALGMRPLRLDPTKDAAMIDGVTPFAGRDAQKIVCASTNGGVIVGPIHLPDYQTIYSLRLAVKAEHLSHGRLSIGSSTDESNAFFQSRFEIAAEYKELEFPDVIRNGSIKFVFVAFDKPGVYWIDNLCVE